jgi:DNA invertase Pin-like site-specific DNA recombinase
MNCVLYARYSTDRQSETSCADQFRECERAAASHGLPVVGRYHDEGISGGTSARPGYQALLTAARANEFKVIVAEDISRLWRNRATYGQDSATLEDAGVHLITATGDDTRRDGWGLVLGIKSAIAEHQRREISYRTRRGLEGLALVGKSTGGRCYGYAPGESVVVVRIFSLAVSGACPATIARTLNAEAVAAPRGPRWSYNTVKRILANPRYAGWLIWGATVSQGGARDSRRTRHVARPEGPLVQRAIPALVDPAIWRACNPGAVVA